VISATHTHPLATPHVSIASYDALGAATDDGWIVLEPQRDAA
ncbi:HAD family hydrolase, partial [Mesorhizobium sp. M4B.F.Ca.ET.088.02.2.1]